jgi:energy-coupling factor transport system permease protein
MTALVQYVPGDTFMHRLDPRAKIVFLLLVTGSVFVIKNLLLAAVLLVLLLGLWLAARLPLTKLLEYARALVGIVVFLFIVQALFYPGQTALVQPLVPNGVPLIGGIGRITWEGIVFALLLSMRLMCMITVLPLISLTTPVHLLALGLVRLGLPYRWAYTMTTALNLVPVLQTEAQLIVDAYRLRAFRVFETGNIVQKMTAYPQIVTPLVIGAMRRAQLVAVAMDSRAFGSGHKRSYIQDINLNAMDWIFMSCSALILVAVMVLSTKIGAPFIGKTF